MPLGNPFTDPKIASNYDSWYYSRGKKAAAQEKSLIKEILGFFPQAETLLEIGCGTGYFTEWFNTLGVQAWGLDRSQSMIYQASEAHQVSCVQGDAVVLPFSRNSFDLVAMITTVAFLENPDQALVEAARVARQGILLGAINKNSLLGWQYRKKGGSIWRAARFFTPRELQRMLSKKLTKDYRLVYKTTLWPLFLGSSTLPWGGFIVMAVIFNRL